MSHVVSTEIGAVVSSVPVEAGSVNDAVLMWSR